MGLERFRRKDYYIVLHGGGMIPRGYFPQVKIGWGRGVKRPLRY